MKKVLVIKLRAMGDTVISTASLNAIKQSLPDCEIHGLFPSHWCPLIANHPSLSHLIPYTKKKGLSQAANLLSLVRKLRKEKYDAVIALHAAGTTANIAKLSGAKQRSIHFHGIHDENKFSTVTIPGKGAIKPIIERDLDCLRALGIPIGDDNDISTSINITDEEVATAKKWLKEKKLTQPLLAIAVGASRPTKIWPMENFVQVAKTWNENGGSTIVIAGPSEKKLTQDFKNLANTEIFLGGELREMAALLKCSNLFLGNDSGPKHLAVAVGTKTFTLFGPENPFEWHPYDQKEHPVFFIDGLKCRKSLAEGLPEWCGIPQCHEEKHSCMIDLTPQQVLSQLLNN